MAEKVASRQISVAQDGLRMASIFCSEHRAVADGTSGLWHTTPRSCMALRGPCVLLMGPFPMAQGQSAATGNRFLLSARNDAANWFALTRSYTISCLTSVASPL